MWAEICVLFRISILVSLVLALLLNTSTQFTLLRIICLISTISKIRSHAVEICFFKDLIKKCVLNYSVLSPVHVCVGQPLAVTNAEKDNKVTLIIFLIPNAT